MNKNSIISAIAVLGSLLSAIYLGDFKPRQNLDIVSIKFCPQTANKFEDNYVESQRKLNYQYCRFRYTLLKEVWDEKQFNSQLPLPEGSLDVRVFKGDDSGGIWLLISPFLAGMGYFSWSIKCKIDFDNKFKKLEDIKTYFKLVTVNARNERDFKETKIQQQWDQQRVNHNQISVEAIQDRILKQKEIDDSKHDAALQELEAYKSDKKKQMSDNELSIAENQEKILNLKTNKRTPPESSKQSYIESLPKKYHWINSVIKEPFMIISGGQGSGKSTFERWLIQCLKDLNYLIYVVNPETIRKSSDRVKVLNKPSEINEFLSDLPLWIERRQEEAREKGIDEDDYLDFISSRNGKEGRVVIFFMESNTYEVHQIDSQVWADALKQSLTNIRKWGFQVYLTAHSANQTSISSELSGFSSRLNSQPRLECIPSIHPDTKEKISSGKALLKYQGVNDKEPLEVDLYHYIPKEKSQY